jgi:hypothetical protein
MKQLLFLAITLWVFLTPTLCVAGVLEHLCDDCVEESCTHEEECVEDPCPDFLIRPSVSSDDRDGDSMPVCLAPRFLVDTGMFLRKGAHPAILQQDPRSNLPVRESELPLLI